MVQCLLIDKNPGERQRLQLILEGLGLNCDERSGVEEGIRFCHENHPEVVMMEASLLPATREFLRLVKYQGRSSHKPVVLLYADKPDWLRWENRWWRVHQNFWCGRLMPVFSSSNWSRRACWRIDRQTRN